MKRNYLYLLLFMVFVSSCAQKTLVRNESQNYEANMRTVNYSHYMSDFDEKIISNKTSKEDDFDGKPKMIVPKDIDQFRRLVAKGNEKKFEHCFDNNFDDDDDCPTKTAIMNYLLEFISKNTRFCNPYCGFWDGPRPPPAKKQFVLSCKKSDSDFSIVVNYTISGKYFDRGIFYFKNGVGADLDNPKRFKDASSSNEWTRKSRSIPSKNSYRTSSLMRLNILENNVNVEIEYYPTEKRSISNSDNIVTWSGTYPMENLPVVIKNKYGESEWISITINHVAH